MEVMTTRPAQRRQLPNSPFKIPSEPRIERFALEDRVNHDTYGLGRVISTEEGAVTVDFGSQPRRIVSPYNGLAKL